MLNNPQIAQMDPDKDIRDKETYAVIGAANFNRAILLNFGTKSRQYKRPAFNLRESAKSADEKI
jgi:hypothetical protein